MKHILSTLSVISLLALATHCSCKKENGNTPTPTYKITFNVTPTGAKVELKENDANGDIIKGNNKVFSNLPAGKYHYSISASGYDTKTGTLDIINSDITEKIDLTLISYKATFTISPSDDVQLILKKGSTSGENMNGSKTNNKIVFSNLTPATYHYSASKTNYDTQTGTIEITNKDLEKTINLERTTYTLTFTLAPENAELTLKKNNEDIAGNNNIFSNLLPGDYTYSASKTGYVTQTGTIAITNKDLEKTINLESIYSLTFTTPTEVELVLRENDASGDPVTGNNNVFSVTTGNYHYTVSKTGFLTETGTINVTQNTNKTISLLEAIFINTLQVREQNTIKGYRWVYFETSSDGRLTFNGKLYFLLKKEGTDKPTANDMKTHPNRMNRTVSATKDTPVELLTKNYTGLSGNAVVSADATEGFTGAGAGDVLEGGATYNVWVMAADDETKINTLLSFTTQSAEQVVYHPSETYREDVNILKLVNDFSPVQIGPNERLMFPISSDNYANGRVRWTEMESKFNDVRTHFMEPEGYYQIKSETKTNIEGTITPATNNKLPRFVFLYGHQLALAQKLKEGYVVISTEKITDTANFMYILVAGKIPRLEFSIKKVP